MALLRPAGLLLAATLPLLGGCVAALVPVVAGGIVAKQELKGGYQGGEQQRAADAPPAADRVAIFTPETAPKSGLAGTAVSAPVASAPVSAPAPVAAEPAPQPVAVPTTEVAVAAPAAAIETASAPTPQAQPMGNDPYSAFTRYALENGVTARPGAKRRSALVVQESLTARPRLADCAAQPAAVLIDLDAGDRPFDLANAPLPAPGLADRLAEIRTAGVTVLWTASLPVSSAERLYTVLQASGLDPQRTDRLLLLKARGERKQQRRDVAAKDWCIVAIAGDKRADFDEVFDYLRDPEGPVAQALEPHFGAGWFLAPPPID